MPEIYRYMGGEEICRGDLITIDFGHEHCIVLRLLLDEDEIRKWKLEDFGPGAFLFSYLNDAVTYVSFADCLQTDETRLIGHCTEDILRHDAWYGD